MLDENKSIESIRAFRKDPGIVAVYQETQLNPYLNGTVDMAIFIDGSGYEYWTYPETGKLIQAAPAAHVPPRSYAVAPEARLSVAELRLMAIETVSGQVPGFVSRRPNLHPLEDNRNREVYFFRWDDSSVHVPESELPPFVQIGLRADGALVSFTNTIN